MDYVTLLIQLVSGAIGGNLGGALFKNLSLGTVGNSLAGVIGGGLGATILSTLLGLPPAATDGGLGDPMAIIGQIASGGVGGIVVMAVVGLVRSMTAK